MGEERRPAERLHNRQFVIGRTAYRVGDDWQSLALSNGYVLSHCPRLKVRRFEGLDGNANVLLGHAFQAESNRPPVEDCLTFVRASKAANESYTWAGRWVLITGDSILGDFSNSLGLFYCREQGELLISSSLALIDRMSPGRGLVRRLYTRHGMNWTPPPTSRLDGVRKLLPDQKIELRTGSIVRVDKGRFVPGGRMEAKEAGGLLLAALGGIWLQMAREFERMRLSLTAGYDSRTLLAAGVSAGVDLDTVTLDFPRMSKADRVLPPELSARIEKPHSLVPRGRPDAERDLLYRRHTFGDISVADRDYYRRDMFHWLKEGECLVRGAVFEVRRRSVHPEFHGLSWEDVSREPARLVRRFWDIAGFRVETQQIGEWVNWRTRHPGRYGWVDQFHIDQRLCGWWAAGEQGLDLLQGTSINPGNCGYIVDLLLSVSPEAQSRGEHLLECIRQSGTGLDETPLNPVLETGLQSALSRIRRVAEHGVIEAANLVGIGRGRA